MGEWVRSLGEQIGNELGQVIAQSVQRTLESAIDVSDLARRLVTNAEFTPRVLWSEGYTKALVMDMVNALIGETWAVWTDLSVSGADGKGKITPVGQRLLARLIDEGSSTQP